MAQQIAATVDSLVASTMRKHIKEVYDQTFKSTPYWAYMESHGMIKPHDGGEIIQVPLEVGENTNFTTFKGYDTIATQPQDPFTVAQYGLKEANISISACRREEVINRGPQKIFDLVDGKIQNLKKTAAKKFDQMALSSLGLPDPRWGDYPLLGLPALVGNATTDLANGLTGSNSVGGIDTQDASNSWWQSTVTDLAGAELSYSTLMQRIEDVREFGDADLIVSDSATYVAWKSALLAQQRYANSDTMAKLGFSGIDFEGLTWITDPYIDTNTLYILDTSKITTYLASFMEQDGWRVPVNQHARYLHFYTAGETTISDRRSQTKFTNFTVPETFVKTIAVTP